MSDPNWYQPIPIPPEPNWWQRPPASSGDVMRWDAGSWDRTNANWDSAEGGSDGTAPNWWQGRSTAPWYQTLPSPEPDWWQPGDIGH